MRLLATNYRLYYNYCYLNVVSESKLNLTKAQFHCSGQIWAILFWNLATLQKVHDPEFENSWVNQYKKRTAVWKHATRLNINNFNYCQISCLLSGSI